MDKEKEPTSAPTPGKGKWFAVGFSKVLKNAEMVEGNLDRIIDASLLGVCFVFLVAMLGLQQQQIDASLTLALVAFVVAIPILANSSIRYFYKVKPVVPDRPELEKTLLISAGIVKRFGWLVVIVGIIAVIRHLSPLAFYAFIASLILIIVAFVVIPVLVGMRNKQSSPTAKQESSSNTSSTPTSSTPVIMKLPPQAPNS